jgi:hypothetical protein
MVILRVEPGGVPGTRENEEGCHGFEMQSKRVDND